MDWDNDLHFEDPRDDPQGRVAHWGPLDQDLLFDPLRYGPFAAAHHTATHHWCVWQAGLPLRSAGLGLASQTSVLHFADRSTRSYMEAASVLGEALAVEAVVHSLHDYEFGVDAEIDWVTVGEHAGACRTDARRRGCIGGPGVDSLLANPDWISVMGRRLLHGWGGIVALAEALGHGRVLEADQVTRELSR